jgi:hypothetical protein
LIEVSRQHVELIKIGQQRNFIHLGPTHSQDEIAAVQTRSATTLLRNNQHIARDASDKLSQCLAASLR